MGWIPDNWFELITWFCIGTNLGMAVYLRSAKQQHERTMAMAKGAFGAGFDRGYEVGVEAAMKGMKDALEQAGIAGKVTITRIPPDEMNDRPPSWFTQFDA